MSRYDHLKKRGNVYNAWGLSDNPFVISPLFRDFKNAKKCEEEEELFIFPSRVERDIKIFLQMKNKRALIYGLYGVGKTTLANFILYLAHNFHKKFCSRIVITEENVKQAINEMLVSLCFDIIAEIVSKPISKPIQSLRHWLIEKHYKDTLMENIARLIGAYTEISEETTRKGRKSSLKAGIPGIIGKIDIETEKEIRKNIQSYVEILPWKMVNKYLEDLLEIIQKMGFCDCIIFIDEADHIGKIDQFLSMLTRGREVLFTTGYTFFVSGSPEIAKHTEAMGAIFDKLVFVKPVNQIDFNELINQRIKVFNDKLSAKDLFEKEALEYIFKASKGIRKHTLRLAENAMDIAISYGDDKISKEHCEEVVSQGRDEISVSLQERDIKILKYLAQERSCSPSNKEFIEYIGVSRVYLRKLLEELQKLGYVNKEKKGKKIYYAISAQYKAYFLEN